MALAKKPTPTPPPVMAKTVETVAVSALSAGDQESSSEQPPVPDLGPVLIVDGPLVPDEPAVDDGPLVPEAPEEPAAEAAVVPAPRVTGEYLLDTGAGVQILDAPAPIQADLTDMADLPPRPDNLPDGGKCHIIWPGQPKTVKGFINFNGALTTTCRHYEARLTAGSNTRWTFRLLYPAGVEIHDRKLAGRLIDANQLTAPAGV